MIIIPISPTAIDSLDTCVQKYAYSNIHGFRPVNPGHSNIDLDQGGLLHEAMRFYYTEKRDKKTPSFNEVQEVMRVFAINNADLEDEDIEDTIESVRLYLDYYADDNWEPLEIEKPFAKVLYEQPDVFANHAFVKHDDNDNDSCIVCGGPKDWECHFLKEEGITILLQGRIDLLVRTQNGQEMIVDHKKEKKKTYPHSLYNQNFSYCFGLDKSHMCLNYVGTQNSRELHHRLHRHVISYSKAQLAEWRLETTCKILRKFQEIRMGWYERNFGSCFKYGRPCDYLRVCEAFPEDRERMLETSFVVRKGEALWK